MTNFKIAFIYQVYKAYRSQYMVYYYLLMFVGVSMYPLGIYYYKKTVLAFYICALYITYNC